MIRKSFAAATIASLLVGSTYSMAEKDSPTELTDTEWALFFNEAPPEITQKTWPEAATPTEWALRLRGRSGIAFVPTTYSTLAECLLAAFAMGDAISSHDKPCTPIHFTPESIAGFKTFMATEKQAADLRREQKRKDDESRAANERTRAEHVRKALDDFAEEERERIAQIKRDRPALEAERRAILDDRDKLSQQRYANRVLEIDAMLREIK